MRSPLIVALGHAVKWGLVGRNVALAVDPARPKTKEMRALDADGVRRLLKAAEGTMYHAAIHLALFTDLRRSELLGPRWQDIRLYTGTLSISRGLPSVARQPRRARGTQECHGVPPGGVVPHGLDSAQGV